MMQVIDKLLGIYLQYKRSFIKYSSSLKVVLMWQLKSPKPIASFKTQKELKQFVKKSQFFEDLARIVNSQFTKDELEFLFVLYPQIHQAGPSAQYPIRKHGFFQSLTVAPKKQSFHLGEISLDVFSSGAKKKFRKIVKFDKELAVGRESQIPRCSTSTAKIKRKVITNLSHSPCLDLEQSQRAKSQTSKHLFRSASSKATYKLSRPKFRQQNSSQGSRQFLSNPKVLKAYSNQFLDQMFRTKTEEDRSDSMLVNDCGAVWENYLAEKGEEEKKFRCIQKLKLIGRHKTTNVRF